MYCIFIYENTHKIMLFGWSSQGSEMCIEIILINRKALAVHCKNVKKFNVYIHKPSLLQGIVVLFSLRDVLEAITFKYNTV